MKIVIQCAARKHPAAGCFIAADGRSVLFVGQPDYTPTSPTQIYARPDDVADDGRTWRARVLDYNERERSNPLAFLPAYQLYVHDAYRALVDRFGVEQVFILSAGWGLIPATFLTPDYDITFTASAEYWKRRLKDERYEDFCLMPDDGGEILFLGGKDYLPLFCRLTARFSSKKIVFFNSARTPDLPAGFAAVRYSTSTRTNWHYECAHDLVAGRLGAVRT